MKGLFFLTQEDFSVSKGVKGNILTTGIPGVSVVLFYSTRCEHCQGLLPLFKKLPGAVSGCQFGMINISVGKNKDVVLKSRNTITDIKVVPYILLFVNGRPYMRYVGPHTIENISKFIYEVSQKVHSKEKLTKNESVSESVRGSIPEYTIGHPLYGIESKVCYLDFGGAYDKENNTGPDARKKNVEKVYKQPGGYTEYGGAYGKKE